MEVLLKAMSAFAIVLMISMASCATDSCTECTDVTGSGMQTFDTLICADQFDSRSDYDDLIMIYEENLGGNCIEK